jgi:hypothetical protein
VTLYDQMKAFFYIVNGNEAVMHEFPFMVRIITDCIPNWDPPPPHPQASVTPPPPFGQTRLGIYVLFGMAAGVKILVRKHERSASMRYIDRNVLWHNNQFFYGEMKILKNLFLFVCLCFLPDIRSFGYFLVN